MDDDVYKLMEELAALENKLASHGVSIASVVTLPGSTASRTTIINRDPEITMDEFFLCAQRALIVAWNNSTYHHHLEFVYPPGDDSEEDE